jgi:hypothetical protein
MQFDKASKFRLRGHKEGGKINCTDFVNYKFLDLVFIF